jgi:hypothetical protein
MTALYDNATQSVLPVLTVTFPPANDTRQSWVNYGQGYMACLRANITRAGSRTAPALPAPTALRNIPHALTKGDKAGIGISCVVVAAILIGLGAWWWLKKKREQKERKAVREMEKRKLELEKERREEQDREEVMNPMMDGVQRHEIMTDVGGRAELDPGIVNELEGSGVPELEN